jgi:hypothetical protein
MFTLEHPSHARLSPRSQLSFVVGACCRNAGHGADDGLRRGAVDGVFGPSFWFLRPTGEAFEMYFDNLPAVLRIGLPLDDITYTDDNADMRHLIKIKVPK